LRVACRPNAYETSIQEKETARADITLANYERTQLLTQAKTTLLSAYITGAFLLGLGDGGVVCFR
jgi:hypothetical protein